MYDTQVHSTTHGLTTGALVGRGLDIAGPPVKATAASVFLARYAEDRQQFTEAYRANDFEGVIGQVSFERLMDGQQSVSSAAKAATVGVAVGILLTLGYQAVFSNDT